MRIIVFMKFKHTESRRAMWWKSEVSEENQAKRAIINGREYPATFRQIASGVHSYTLTGPRGATYKAMPVKVEGLYQVLSFPGSRFMGYAKVENGVLVDAPEYR